jgi:hypothetical protein
MEDLTIGDTVVPAGSIVIVGIAAANRDPRRFAEPDRLDITRGDDRHLAFGRGLHRCLGAPLARMEGSVAISALLRRFPTLRLGCAPEELSWQPAGSRAGPTWCRTAGSTRPTCVAGPSDVSSRSRTPKAGGDRSSTGPPSGTPLRAASACSNSTALSGVEERSRSSSYRGIASTIGGLTLPMVDRLAGSLKDQRRFSVVIVYPTMR